MTEFKIIRCRDDSSNFELSTYLAGTVGKYSELRLARCTKAELIEFLDEAINDIIKVSKVLEKRAAQE